MRHHHLTATLEAVTGERHDEWAIAIERKGETLSVVVRG